MWAGRVSRSGWLTVSGSSLVVRLPCRSSMRLRGRPFVRSRRPSRFIGYDLIPGTELVAVANLEETLIFDVSVSRAERSERSHRLCRRRSNCRRSNWM